MLRPEPILRDHCSGTRRGHIEVVQGLPLICDEVVRQELLRHLLDELLVDHGLELG